jgi:NodT family efflux transporter outer membrane factor (OMF) lipoprotein
MADFMKSGKGAVLAIAGALISLSACTVGPDFQRPAAPEAARLTRADTPLAFSTATGTAGRVDRAWWRSYDSPAIERLVERALEYNADIAAATANLASAQHIVAAQQGFFYPSIQAGYVGGRQSTGRTLAPAVNSGDSLYSLHTAQLSIGFVPDLLGGNRRQVESLQAQADAQRFQIDALRTTIASTVVAAAIQAASLEAQITVATDLVLAATASREHLARLHASGYASAIDLANQENLEAQYRAQVEPLRKQREQTLDLLGVLCGSTPDAILPAPTWESIRFPTMLPEAVPSVLVSQRPDVRAAEELIRASNAQIGVATANLLPQFSITALIGGSASAISRLFDAGNSIWGAGIGAGQTLFAGGTLLERRRAAEAARDAALAQYRSTALTAFQNVADALYALDADRRALMATQAAERAARRSLDLTQVQTDRGYASALAVLAARQGWLSAKAARVQSESVHLGDSVALYQALGGGWHEAGTP